MPVAKKGRPVLRNFARDDHEKGVTARYSPDGKPDVDPTKEPCSVYDGPIDPEYVSPTGPDGCGPLIGDDNTPAADSGKEN